jgi:muramoyltetrapeptide carboxypeptidase
MIHPPRLRAGDVVRLIAPSGPVPRDAFQSGVAVLKQRYEVRFDEALFAREGFLAGPDERRLGELAAALGDADTRAIVMARGGYGLMRLLPFIDPDLLRAAPRPVVGFSDGTALLAFAARAGVASIHGPVLTQLGGLGTADQQALFRLLEEPAPGVVLANLDEVIPGRVQGPLLGGNLEVFSRLLGTPFLPDLAGVFSAVSAVIVGDFAGCKEPESLRAGSPTADEVLLERLGRLPIPVVLGAAIGHGARNFALPYGCMAELDTRHGTLVALEGAVS